MVQYDPTGSRQAGYNYVGNILDERDRRRAGVLYAGGDQAGAANTLASAGMIGDARAINQDVQRTQTAQRTQAKEQRAEDNAWLLQAATGLRQVPYAQRRAVYQSQIRPLLQQNGFDDAELQRVDAADLSDGELDALMAGLGGTVTAPYANDRSGPNGGVIRPDRYTGEYSPVYTAPFDPRTGASPGYMWADETRTRQVAIPGGPADPAVAAPLAAARRAPPRGRSGGSGSSGGSSSSRPAAPSAKPWERNW